MQSFNLKFYKNEKFSNRKLIENNLENISTEILTGILTKSRFSRLQLAQCRQAVLCWTSGSFTITLDTMVIVRIEKIIIKVRLYTVNRDL